MRTLITILYFALNTVFWCLLLYFFLLLKLLSPFRAGRDFFSRRMVGAAGNWISGNSRGLALLQNIEWDVQGLDKLDLGHSYLVCSNHQCWVDIVVLQQIFNRRIPFLRFFIKQSLVYVPLLGGAWWGLDFPFMKRYSTEYLRKHPEKRGQDLETTRKACEKFRGKKISILNFLEGTRFKPAKHAKQKSPYKHLLKPKAGGMAFVLEAMGRQFHSFLDVTIYYPHGPVELMGLFSGQLKKVVVRVREIPIPVEFCDGNYLEDPAHREKFQAWIHEIWSEKDRMLENLSR